MKKFVTLAALAAVAAVPAVAFAETTQAVHEATEEASAQVQMSAGTVLYAANGVRVARIYRVNQQGNPQVILDGRLITVPASTLSDVSGKLTTSLSKKEISLAK